MDSRQCEAMSARRQQSAAGGMRETLLPRARTRNRIFPDTRPRQRPITRTSTKWPRGARAHAGKGSPWRALTTSAVGALTCRRPIVQSTPIPTPGNAVACCRAVVTSCCRAIVPPSTKPQPLFSPLIVHSRANSRLFGGFHAFCRTLHAHSRGSRLCAGPGQCRAGPG